MDTSDTSIGVQYESSKSIISPNTQHTDFEMTTFLVGGCMRSGMSLLQAVLAVLRKPTPKFTKHNILRNWFTFTVMRVGHSIATYVTTFKISMS